MQARKDFTNKIHLVIVLATLTGFGILTAVDGIVPLTNFAPDEVGTIISDQLGNRHHNQPIVFNGYAILAGNAEHEVWDISDPYNPALINEMISSHNQGEAESHQVTLGTSADGRYLMATTSGKGFDLWDLTETSNPAYLKAFELPGVNYGDVDNAVWGLSLQGRYLYVGATNHGLYVVDISDPENPELTVQVPTSEIGGLKPGPLFALGSLLVITSPKGNNGVATLDISDPSSPYLLDVINYRNDHSYIGGFYGKHAVLISPLRFYDVTTNPQNIRQVASMEVVPSEYISFDENQLFLGGLRGGSQGIHIYDISDLENIQKTLHIPGRSVEWDDQFSVPVGNMIIMSDDQLVNGQYVGSVIAVHQQLQDTTPPVVLYTNPADSAQNVPVSGSVAVSFSDWIEFKSVNDSSFIIKDEAGNEVSGTWSWAYTTVNFTPDAPLEEFTSYEIILPANGITDLSGNAFSEDYRLGFTTGNAQSAIIAPTVDQPAPALTGAFFSWQADSVQDRFDYYWTINEQVIGEGQQVTWSVNEPGRYQGCLKLYDTTAYREVGLYEAEEAELGAGLVAASNHPNYTGSGFADFPATQGDSVALIWTIDVLSADTFDLGIRYANGGTFDRGLNIYVNGAFIKTGNFPPTEGWDVFNILTLGDISLIRGKNEITLTANAGAIGPNLDHLKIINNQEKLFNPGKLLASTCFVQVAYEQTEVPPKSSNSMLYSGNLLWNANPDANTVSVIDTELLEKTKEITVGTAPKSLTKVGETIWVANRDSYNISVISITSRAIIKTIALPYASQPTHILASHDEKYVYVSLGATGKVIKLSVETENTVATCSLGEYETAPVPGGMALDADGHTLLVNRFISNGQTGEVYVIDPADMSLIQTIALDHYETIDASNRARGIPNYLEQIAINPNGREAWVPSKQDNVRRGMFRDGLALDHQTTVRTITSRIDLATGKEALEKRIDIDNSERCNSITFNHRGDLAFVTLPGNNKLVALDANTGEQLTEIATGGLVPDASVFNPTTGQVYVHNFLSRSISVIDVSAIQNGTGGLKVIKEIPVVENELLPEKVLRGKRNFYDASSKKLNQSGYMSCASCHLDGSHDGMVWDFTNMGEGFRNTIDLRGRSGTAHGRLHWTANFDEIHDFENQIRNFGAGTGLMEDGDFAATKALLGPKKAGLSDDLDALTAYVSSLSEVPPSPYKTSDGGYSQTAINGAVVFSQKGCDVCHSGEAFTDSPSGKLHDIGTIKENSGLASGSAISGFDTPTLKGLWNTAPYLHNGSAPTIADAITAHADITINETELASLVQFLRELDEADIEIPLGTRLEADHALALYPNPVTGQFFTIGVDSPETIQWQLFTLNGQMLSGGTGQKVAADRLANGLYFVRISVGEKQYSRKVVVRR